MNAETKDIHSQCTSRVDTKTTFLCRITLGTFIAYHGIEYFEVLTEIVDVS